MAGAKGPDRTGGRGGAGPSIWTLLGISVLSVLALQALAGTPTSPVERWLHIQTVPFWLPLAMAAGLGIVFGSVFRRRMAGAVQPAKPTRSPSTTRGRHAVPRRIRRQRQRQDRALDRAASRERQEAAAAAAQARAAAPPPPTWWERLRRRG